MPISKYIRKRIFTEEAHHRSFIIVCLFLLVLLAKNSRLGLLPENSGFSYFQEIMQIPFSSWEFDTQMNSLSLGGELWLDKRPSFRRHHLEFHFQPPLCGCWEYTQHQTPQGTHYCRNQPNSGCFPLCTLEYCCVLASWVPRTSVVKRSKSTTPYWTPGITLTTKLIGGSVSLGW